MLFWIVAGTLAALVAGLLARPLLAPAPPVAEASPDQGVYRDQLRELERDRERGLIAPEEAERARVEVARRLLAADRAGPLRLGEAPRGIGLAAAALAAATVVLGSLLLYSGLGRPGTPDQPRAGRLAEAEAARAARPSQAEAEARAAALMPVREAPEDYLALVEDLRRIVPERGDDLRGWELLAMHEARLGRWAEAARAQERVVGIKGREATAADWLGLADRMVAAAGGVVTPEAEAVLSEIAAREPEDLGLLYYRGLLEAQTGRADRAFPLWREVVEEAPEDSLHRRLALGQIGEVAWLAGVDYQPPAAPAAADPAAQEAAIRDMVEGLAGRLSEAGGPPEEWARLVTSLAVLGDRDGAAEALAQARAAHGDHPEAASVLDAAAAQAGLE